ncbi:MAG: pyridoxal phosphate-dependent aminotransferase [Dehalococcoidia bacterium]|nr:pyridoxal phosphate-dependent aminotransferase [Dehalococcoidia bacterium]MSQ34468.1 pyridoxal phosphate-dependent aminotransferase [Dehalococcoidia bacterium]
MAISKTIREQMKESSWIRRMFEEGTEMRRKHGADKVFDLSLGNPVLEPPTEFRTELMRIAQDETPGTHRYMPNTGYAETRAAVAKTLAAETGMAFTAGEILMTCGAAGALNVTLRSILDRGDEVVIFAPYFAEYIFYIQHNGGVMKVAQCDSGFQPDVASLAAALTARTRAVIINSPNNPTGVIYPASIIAAIGQAISAAEKTFGTEIYLIADEPYRKLIYSGQEYPFVYKYHQRSIVATSHSKDLGLAGERIGYIAVNPGCPDKSELLEAAVFANRTLGFVNAPAIMQRIVARIQGASVDVDEYRKKRDFLYGALTGIGYECVKPEGAFYMFPKSPLPDDRDFIRLLQSKFVLCVPGVGFGTPGYFRISYCVDDRTLKGCVPGFREAYDEAKTMLP